MIVANLLQGEVRVEQRQAGDYVVCRRVARAYTVQRVEPTRHQAMRYAQTLVCVLMNEQEQEDESTYH